MLGTNQKFRKTPILYKRVWIGIINAVFKIRDAFVKPKSIPISELKARMDELKIVPRKVKKQLTV